MGARVPDPNRYAQRAADGRVLLVALDALGEPAAYGDLEADGHVDNMYCRPDLTGQGVSSALYEAIEAAARNQGMARLYVEASEGAKPLFLKKGFTITERRDFEIRGVLIHNYLREKRL